ncbi:MAG: response regulator [Cyanobacteria bacterium P01_D01_bin.14]
MKHVLIIDDDADIREVAQLALETVGGWRVSVASSGPEGLDQMRSDAPDAALLDVMMPNMDGVEVFKAMQTEPKIQNIPVVFMTAKTQAADQQRFLALGAAGIITKPFKAMLLADQVASLLHW